MKIKFNNRAILTVFASTLFVAVLVFVVACGVNRTTINVDGSSTVFPITQRVAEDFRSAGNTDIQIPIAVSGTGGGFKRFTAGETDISNASRPIKASERQAALDAGVNFIELTVAYDGIAVLTHNRNTAVSCLTTAELKQIWNTGSTVNNWNQIKSNFPDAMLDLYAPDRDSGTFDYFTAEINGQEGASRSDYSASANDNVLVTGVSTSSNSLGYFGFAYYIENQAKLRLIAVDSGNGCISPSLSTIGGGTYTPLARPLFIYVNTASLQRPEVRNFVEFYLDNAATISQEVGYVALPASDYAVERAKLNAN